MSGPSFFRRFFASVFVFLLGAALTLVGSPAASGAPRVTSPDNAAPGSAIEISGGGFGAYEAVDVYFDDRDLVLGVANASGRFGDVRLTIPRSMAPGTHWLTLVGRRTGRSAQQAIAIGTDWPQYGFDAGRTGFNPYERGLGQWNVDDLRIAWSADLTDPDWDARTPVLVSPAVADGVVFAAAAGYFQEHGRFEALDAATGETVWVNRSIGEVLASPAVADGRVFVSVSYPFELVALSATTGRVLWRRPTMPSDLALEGENFQVTPVLVAGGTVYVSVRAAYWDQRAGEVRTYSRLYAFDTSTGATRWARHLDGRLAARGSTLFVASGHRLLALRASDGATLWREAPVGRDGYLFEPTVTGATVYLGSWRDGARYQRVYAFNAGTGGVRWRVALGRSVPAAPAVADGVVYVVTGSGRVHALEAGTGARLWAAAAWPAHREATLGSEGVMPAPSVAGGTVYVGSLLERYLERGLVSAFRSATGQTLWSTRLDGSVVSRPAVVDARVFVGTYGGSLYGFAVPSLGEAITARPDPAQLEVRPRLRPGESHDVTPRIRGWDRVAAGGLGRAANATAASTVLFRDELYVGTRVRPGAGRGAEIWRSADGITFERAGEPGFGNPANTAVELAVFGDRLFAATSNAQEGFELWVSDDGSEFTLARSGGAGDVHATPIAFSGRLLLAVDNSRKGARILASDDGEAFQRVAEPGFGDPANAVFAAPPAFEASPSVVFGEQLYLGTVNRETGAEVWATSNGLEWAPAALDGLRSLGNRSIVPQLVFEDRLYAVTKSAEGFEAYRTADGETWERVATAGFRAGPRRNVAASLAVTGRHLVLVTRNRSERAILDGRPIETGVTHGFQVYRSDDGERWRKIGRDGFGDPHFFAGTVLAEGGVSYIVGRNHREGDAVWRSEDGKEWTVLFREARPTPMTTALGLAVFDRHLLLLHGDLAGGLSLWRFRREVPVTHIAATPAPPAPLPPPGEEAAPTWIVPGILAVVAVGALVILTAVVVRVRHLHGGGLRPRHA